MSGELFTEEAYPNGLRCMGCGHEFEEFEPICERPGDYPDLEVVGRRIAGQPVRLVELICKECVRPMPMGREEYVPLSVRYGGRREKFGWWVKGQRERVALRLAPWLGGYRTYTGENDREDA